MSNVRTKHSTVTPIQAEEKELLDAEVAGGAHEELAEEIDEFLGIPQAFLTDAQWEALRDSIRLSDRIRVEINLALRRYWHTVTNERVSQNTFTQIADVRRKISDLTISLLELADNPDLFKRQIIHFAQSAREQRQTLVDTCTQVDQADTILSLAEERLKTKPDGPSNAALYELVYRLDHILNVHANAVLTRSSKKKRGTINTRDFVTEVVKAADLKITDQSVHTVIRNYISDRNAGAFRRR
jgi:hypothetical protein